MKPNEFAKIFGLLIFLLLVSCQKESLELDSNSNVITDEILSESEYENPNGRKGKPQRCTEYRFRYEVTPPSNSTKPVFTVSGDGIVERCLDEFQGNDRILGIFLSQVGEDCLPAVNGNGNANCGGYLEMYYKTPRPERYGYWVILSNANGDGWTNTCAPMPNDPASCLNVNLMEIRNDGRHDKDCIKEVQIDSHQICITNEGEV
jgi:hypothetical protein